MSSQFAVPTLPFFLLYSNSSTGRFVNPASSCCSPASLCVLTLAHTYMCTSTTDLSNSLPKCGCVDRVCWKRNSREAYKAIRTPLTSPVFFCPSFLVLLFFQNKYLNKIMQWLEECEITYTQTAKPWNWKAMMADIRSDNRFYLDTYEDGERKPAGW